MRSKIRHFTMKVMTKKLSIKKASDIHHADASYKDEQPHRNHRDRFKALIQKSAAKAALHPLIPKVKQLKGQPSLSFESIYSKNQEKTLMQVRR